MQATAEKVVGGTAEVLGKKAKDASLLTRIASRFGVDRELVYTTLKNTAFRQRADRETGQRREPTNEEMVALLIIADQYGLNPFTRELYAFYDPKSGAIVAIVSIDGWVRIVNERPELQKIEFRYSEERVELKNGKWAHEWVDCLIYRTDREAPMVAREYFEEVYREMKYDSPWDTHPKRFHRHKAFIQCARYAFGFAGVVDPDEAERVIEGEAMRMSDIPLAIANINKAVAKGKAQPAAIEHSPGEAIPAGKVEQRETETVVTDAPQDKKTDAPAPTNGGKKQEAAAPTYAEVRNAIDKAKDTDAVDVAESMVDGLPEQFRAELHELAKTRRAALTK